MPMTSTTLLASMVFQLSPFGVQAKITDNDYYSSTVLLTFYVR